MTFTARHLAFDRHLLRVICAARVIGIH